MGCCTRTLLRACMLFACLGLALGATAQALRDPTQAPLEQPAAIGGLVGGLDPSTGVTVLVRAGVPYLAVDTRLYKVGQKLGTARVERITETEVWLRDGGTLHKLPRFVGVQRSTVSPTSIPVDTCPKATPKPKRATMPTTVPAPSAKALAPQKPPAVKPTSPAAQRPATVGVPCLAPRPE